jgi:DNA-directed RNA polymerase specialized sigma24 family protein
VATLREAPTQDFARLYQEQYAPMIRLARMVGAGEAAEDVVQEAFADVYRLFKRVDHPPAYLRRAVISRTLSVLRRRGVERRFLARQATTEVVGPLGPEGAAVRAAMARLGPRQRAAVFLRYYLDLPEAAIADALDCRAGTVKSLLHRSHEILRRHLDG